MKEIITEENRRQTIDQIWELVPRVWNPIRNHLRTIAVVQFDISVEQFHVLRHIRKGLTSVSDIADARQISRSAVSQAAEMLVEKGLVTRRQEVDDRRFVHLALTPQGEDLLNQIFQQTRTWMMEKMTSYSAAELAMIAEGLVLLKSAFESSAEKIEADATPVNGI
jgi:DNA-binding MarR family transcriptional regulator